MGFIAQEELEPGQWNNVSVELRHRGRATDIATVLYGASGRRTRVIRVMQVIPAEAVAEALAPLVVPKTAAKRAARKEAK